VRSLRFKGTLLDLPYGEAALRVGRQGVRLDSSQPGVERWATGSPTRSVRLEQARSSPVRRNHSAGLRPVCGFRSIEGPLHARLAPVLFTLPTRVGYCTPHLIFTLTSGHVLRLTAIALL